MDTCQFFNGVDVTFYQILDKIYIEVLSPFFPITQISFVILIKIEGTKNKVDKSHGA
jgi:hypothetical protein